MTAGAAEELHAQVVWRPVRAARVLAGLFLAVLAVATITGAVVVVRDLADARPSDAASDLGVTALLVVPAALFSWVSAFRPFIAIDDRYVIVRNTLTVRIPHRDITHVHPGRSGIRIWRRDGSLVVASAVQKAPLSRWLGRRTRADDVAAAIRHVSGAGARVQHRRRRRVRR